MEKHGDDNNIIDDDDEILVVSTTQQKWEKLQREASFRKDDGSTTEDDIMLFRTKPARPIRSHTSFYEKLRHSYFGAFLLPQVGVLFFLSVAITVLLYTRRKSKRKRSTNQTCQQMNFLTRNAAATTTTTTTKVEVSKTTSTTTVTTTEHCHTEVPDIHFHSRSNSNVKMNLQESEHTNYCNEITSLDHPEETSLSDTIASGELHTEKTHHVQMSTNTSPSNHNLEVVRQITQDIQLVQKVLQEQSMDPSLAPQLAMSLHSSRHFVDFQRELHYQQALFTNHQRQLDRQLSQRQHQESLQAFKYDPSWEEKLWSQKRHCWNVSHGLLRLWGEVFLLQQVTRGFVPVWKRYYVDTVEPNEHQSILANLTWSVLAQVCDCQGNAMTTSWTSTLAGYAMVTSDSTRSIPGILLLLNNLLSTWIDLDYCSCYGYCFLSAGVVALVTTTSHYLIRVLCMPDMFHHIINATVLTYWIGLHRITRGIWNTTVTFFAIPAKETNEIQLMEFGLMVSILILLPTANWWRTRVVYGDVWKQVSRADASEFEVSFRRGQQRLEQWKWQQVSLRYLLLSLYTALLLGHGGDGVYLSNSSRTI
ncbi:hypothetical protein IV203_013198 [Nitzschia inconspicua]|uniref:Uncharacterized protein n=1 Tax=Nitzschia inconspicua TaxID=303405 RepID=A0A9K3M5L0_9STRA|nr:hypothetical protein IV203_013198 [Nitzschia inconspicua]